MRVLHVISSLDPRTGGPALALAGLARAQKRVGLDVAVLATWRRGADLSLADRFRQGGVEVHLLGPCFRWLAWHWGIGPAARRLVPQADVVHLHGLWEEIQHQAARVARRHGKPYVLRPCGMLDRWSLAQQGWKKRLYLAWRVRKDLNRAAAIHYTTEIERRQAEPLGLTAPALVEPNGVDLDELTHLPPRGTFRARYPELAGRPVVLFLSRLHYKKGLEILLPAFARVRAGEPRLVLAGPDWDGYRPHLEALAGRLGLGPRILFTGMLNGVDRFAALADADLFVLPSYQENFAVAVVEALAVGTPVVISDQVAVYPEVQAAGVGGVVPTEVEPLARELERWLADPGLRAAASARARPFVAARYAWDQIARRWQGHYGRFLRAGERGASPPGCRDQAGG